LLNEIVFAVNFTVSKITETFIRSFRQPRAEAREKAGNFLTVTKKVFRVSHGVPPFKSLTTDDRQMTTNMIRGLQSFVKKQKSLHPLRDEGFMPPRYHPELSRNLTSLHVLQVTLLAFFDLSDLPDLSFAVTGLPGADYFCRSGLQPDLLSPAQSLLRVAGEFGLLIGAPDCAVKGFHLALPSR
jgi:hypothetical protein